MKTLTRKPGEFRAVCKQGSWQPLDKLTPEQRAAVDADPKLQRWDTRLRAEVAIVECTLDTTDAAAYLRHMADVHNKKPGHRRAWPTPAVMRRPWHGPKLKDEGASFVSRDGVARTCRGCGEVVELPLIEEHKDTCPEREAGAA